MKFSTAINAFLTIAAASAPTSTAFLSSSSMQAPMTALSATRVDTSDLIEEALAASKKYGASSPEARLAWEVVEEIDASDNSVATLGASDDFQGAVQGLANKLKLQQPAMASLNGMAEEIKAIKLSAPKSASSNKSNPKLQAAMKEAKQLTEIYGAHSSEAKLAWETVEELASSNRIENAMGGMLTPEECLVDAAIGACEALEELNRVFNTHAEEKF